MTDQEPIICEACGQSYPQLEDYCPHCGELNPLVDEEFLDEEYLDEAYLDDDAYIDEDGFVDDDAFIDDEDFIDNEEAELDAEVAQALQRTPWWRSPIGCISILLFLLFIIGGPVLGVYSGLQERAVKRQEVVNDHYQRALALAQEERTVLAIAELNQVLALNPAHYEARELLGQLRQTIEPTPTVVNATIEIPVDSSTEDLFEKAKTLALQGSWPQTIQLLDQIRKIEPDFEPKLISEALYTANYEMGLRLMQEDNLTEALHAFDRALEERPNDSLVTEEWEKVSLYLSLDEATPENYEDQIIVLSRLYNLDPELANVKNRLLQTYLNFGDYLIEQEDWCLALPRLEEAANLSPDDALSKTIESVEEKCDAAQQASLAALLTPTPPPTSIAQAKATGTTNAITVTETVTATKVVTGALNGTIYFGRYNTAKTWWEIIGLSLPDKEESVVLIDGTQPGVSPNGNKLAYRTEEASFVGLHVLNLNTQEDVRATVFAEDMLPRWGNSAQEFVFVSQRSGDRRWEMYIGFADGKGDAVVIKDGRTPDIARDNVSVVYQGTDAQGNNPGLYLTPRGGGETVRITENESDRSPAISPNGKQLVFMSTKSGNWDLWLTSINGGTAKRLTKSPANDGLPAWSPDGAHVAFVSDRSGSWGIYVITLADGSIEQVADWGGTHPDWLLQQISWGP